MTRTSQMCARGTKLPDNTDILMITLLGHYTLVLISFFSSLPLSIKGPTLHLFHLALCFQPPAERLSFGFPLEVAATFITSQRAHFQSYFLKGAAS